MKKVFLLIGVIIVFVLIGLYFYHEEKKLNDKVMNYLYSNRDVSFSVSGAAYGIIGLTAPNSYDDVHGFFEYGKIIVEAAIDKHRSSGFLGLPEITPNEKEIRLSGNFARSEILCWVSVYEDNKNKDCLAEDKLRHLIEDNKKLIDRFSNLDLYHDIDWDVAVSRNDNLLVPINLLYLAGLRIDYFNSQADDTFEKLLSNLEYWLLLLSKDTSLVFKAITQVIVSDTLSAMELYLNEQHYINEADEKHLQAITAPTIATLNINNALIREFKIAEMRLCLSNDNIYYGNYCLVDFSSLFYDKNQTLNHFYYYIDELTDYLENQKNVLSEPGCRLTTLEQKNSDFLDKYLFNNYGHRMISYYKGIVTANRVCDLIKITNNINNTITNLKERYIR